MSSAVAILIWIPFFTVSQGRTSSAIISVLPTLQWMTPQSAATTVASGSIEVDELAGSVRLPSGYPLPILRVGRLAVDSRFQGQGLGKLLLSHAFLLALRQRESTGCVGIVVDAKPRSVSFYHKLGFRALKDVLEGEITIHPSPLPMFLPVRSIPMAT